jgi:hypothetical protein
VDSFSILGSAIASQLISQPADAILSDWAVMKFDGFMRWKAPPILQNARPPIHSFVILRPDFRTLEHESVQASFFEKRVLVSCGMVARIEII